MAVEWSEAPRYIIDIAQRLIEQHHPELLTARIAFIMRSEAPRSNGKLTLGKASKVSPMAQVHIDFDYIIWIARDTYLRLSGAQQEALIDHELCHLQWIQVDEGGIAKLRGHDVEEFAEIIARHGYWWPGSDEFETVVQGTFSLPRSPDEPQRSGTVGTIDFGKIARDAVDELRAFGVDAQSISDAMEE